MEFGEMKRTSPAIFKFRCFPVRIEAVQTSTLSLVQSGFLGFPRGRRVGSRLSCLAVSWIDGSDPKSCLRRTQQRIDSHSGSDPYRALVQAVFERRVIRRHPKQCVLPHSTIQRVKDHTTKSDTSILGMMTNNAIAYRLFGPFLTGLRCFYEAITRT